jgi:RNA polymerase sigma-70 factor, ECF subfamily
VTSSVSGRGALRADTDIDVALMARLVARDATAIGELYDRHCRVLYGLILRILKQHGEAEEVLQEVFMSAWTRADSFDATVGAPIAWLLRIARNRALDRLRANAVRVRAVESAPPANREADTPETHTAARQQQAAVRRALDTLPADQRELIEQAYFLGLTQSELAARHGLPLGTVKTRVRTAMSSLREQLAAVDDEA